jgi:hypothetical protein
MNEINVAWKTQQINIKLSQRIATVTKAGPIGPAGVMGPEGPQGPQGPAGIHVGTTPPADTSILWYDTN